MASPVDTSVKYFHSAMAGAPVLSGTAGAMIAVLDACLVNGFGVKNVDSLVIANNVATMNISAGGIPAEVGSVVLVAGATPAALNGEQRITAATGVSVSFATTGLADQSATGAITMKMASGGWEKPYFGTNVAAYKSSNPQATGMYLRIDDTSTTSCTMRGWEQMTSISAQANPFPTGAQGVMWWSKSDAANATAKDWILVTDGRYFLFGRQHRAASAPAYELTGFGDLVPVKSGDPWACVLSGYPVDSSVAAPNTNSLWSGDGAGATHMFAPRSYTGLGSSAQMRKQFNGLMHNVSAQTSGKGPIPYPNPCDGGLYLTPLGVSEASNLAYRGVVPGVYGTPQNISQSTFVARDTVVGTTNMPGRIFKALTCEAAPTSGVCFVDIIGPWR